MNQVIRFIVRILGAVFLLGLPPLAVAQPADATADEVAWFAGEWTVTPAPVEGFDDVVANPITTVRIEHRGGAAVVRHSPERNGRPAVSVAFTVKKLGATFPWWPEGGGPVSVVRKVSENCFDLARVGAMGKADWSRALRHTRVVTATENETLEQGADAGLRALGEEGAKEKRVKSCELLSGSPTVLSGGPR